MNTAVNLCAHGIDSRREACLLCEPWLKPYRHFESPSGTMSINGMTPFEDALIQQLKELTQAFVTVATALDNQRSNG